MSTEPLDFLIGLGQTIPVLSTAAKNRLLGRIRDGFDQGLWPLQHELRVAANLSNSGWDISFHDLEVDGGYDFLVTKDGASFEIEAKAISAYTGWLIKPEDLVKLQVEIKQHFDCFDDGLTSIAGVSLSSSLLADRTYLKQLVSEIANVVVNENDASSALGEFQFIGKIPLSSPGSIALAAQLRAARTKNPVLFQHVHPRLVLELSSKKPNQLGRRIIRTINEAAREQFSGSIPGVIWAHVNFLPNKVFNSLSTSQHGVACLFDGIANAVFTTGKRSHISQLCFTGGSILNKQGEIARSSYISAIYDAPACRFGSHVLLPGGRKKNSTKKRDEESVS